MKCEICGKEIKNLYYLSMHLIKNHKDITKKEYYDKFLKKENEGICLECKSQTNFIGTGQGYNKYCSVKCSTNNKEVKEKFKSVMMKKYGVDNPAKSKMVQKKKKLLSLERTGFESSNQIPEIKEKKRKIYFEKFGGPAPYSSEKIRKKGEQTFLKHYGVTSNLKSKEWIEKNKSLLIKKYGVDNYSKTHKFREFARKMMKEEMVELGLRNNKKFSPLHGKNEKNVYNDLQPYCFYKLLEDQEIGGLWPDWLIKELMIVIEYDESHHLIKSYKNHDKIKDEYYILKGYIPIRIKEKDWFEDKKLQITKIQETINFAEKLQHLN